MSIKMKGFEKLLNGSGYKMSIKQTEEGYYVKVKNGRISLFPEEVIFEGDKDETVLLGWVSDFISTMNINSIEIIESLVSFDDKVFLTALGNKKISIELNKNDFDKMLEVYKAIIDKYRKNRKSFLKNTNIQVYDIASSETNSSYGMFLNQAGPCYEINREQQIEELQIKLLSDDSEELLSFEKSFISKFVFEKLCSVGSKAKVMNEDEFYGAPGVGKYQNYFICCGDVIISVANEEKFGFLFDIVHKYNKGVETGKIRVKKVGE